jgi:glycosyltransferase involved in cell wall biosynthesis
VSGRRAEFASQARARYRRAGGPVVVAVLGGGRDARRTLVAARRTTPVRRVRMVRVASVAAARSAVRPGEDLVLLRAGARPQRGWLQALQLAAKQASGAVVGPRLVDPQRVLASVGLERRADGPAHRFAARPADWPPAAPLRAVEALDGACLYVRADAVELLDHAAGSLDDAAAAVCVAAWDDRRRVLVAPAATVIAVPAPPRAPATGGRSVHADDGGLRIVYVTQDTGVGGGHRVVFTHLNGLAERGHEVELWTLADGGPDWFDLHVPVRSFPDYPTLSAALAPLDAIKVATWWETADWVWEASLRRGIPVYWVQDIETTYYPTDPVGRADVLSSYRPEFAYFAGSQWIRGQLHALGIAHVTTFTPGLDTSAVGPLEGVEREPDVILALGRSNPLKDFPLTRAAYLALPEPRPRLWLYGIEPDLVDGLGEHVTYIERPTDAEVNRLLNQATILLQTSKHEGFCLPPLEAMAAGAAVVCTDANGNRDFCTHGHNCLMPDRTATSVREAITRLLHDPDLRRKLTTNGHATATTYAWPTKLDTLDHHYRTLAHQRAGELAARPV